MTAGTRRRLLRVVQAVALLLALGLLALVVAGFEAFGHRAQGARLARMERSPQWHAGHFRNPQPITNDWWGALTGLLHASQHT